MKKGGRKAANKGIKGLFLEPFFLGADDLFRLRVGSFGDGLLEGMRVSLVHEVFTGETGL